MRQFYWYSSLMLGLFLYSCGKCEVKYDYKDILLTSDITDFVPYDKDSTFMMKCSNGTIVHYRCTDRYTTTQEWGADTYCSEKKANCHFANTVSCDGHRYFDIVVDLKCEEEDSLSLLMTAGSIDNFEVKFKNNPASYLMISSWTFHVENKCNYDTCLANTVL